MTKTFLSLVLATASLAGCFPQRQSSMDRFNDDLEEIRKDLGPGPHVVGELGELERVRFRPVGCTSERPVCDDGIVLAVGYGGTLGFEVVTGGESSWNLDFESSAPDVLSLLVEGSLENRRVTVSALSPGFATLIALRADGTVLDRFTLEVRAPLPPSWSRENEKSQLVHDGLRLRDGGSTVLAIDVRDADGSLLVADVAWDMVDGDNIAVEFAFDHRETNYTRQISGLEPGSALLVVSTLGWDIEIPIEVTAAP